MSEKKTGSLEEDFQNGQDLARAVNSQKLISPELPIHPINCGDCNAAFRPGDLSKGVTRIRRKCVFYFPRGQNSRKTRISEIELKGSTEGDATTLECKQGDCGNLQ